MPASARELEDDRQLPLRVGVEIPDTDAEGPGRRYAVWVQGCPMRCPGCCNPELLPFRGGAETTAGDLLDRILAARARSAQAGAPLEGLSLLGGEPFAQAEGLAPVAEAARAAGLSVMIYSGFTLEELRAQIAAGTPGVARLLAATDLLCDGRYERAQPDDTRRWIGSSNQRLHFLSERHHPAQPCFSAGETVELRLSAEGELTINGWPWGRGLP
ncbi:radical SAM protein [Pseudenhygromyxa sp. WMMC2535]|uniref:4Fe-4S single cluster domain-containing protein n=1 Tax=Pseudenhygromyxa sp. WMMC2535 TaxID=2712867 RepID=UPI001556733B|nr:4Fe-4S single cluster domain-containing protein [Pseudenhygromyxa sp. WMMC2535]NVB40368.1 radical SAM protein [Pseudenhygromyxa sp. WMMC2535]